MVIIVFKDLPLEVSFMIDEYLWFQKKKKYLEDHLKMVTLGEVNENKYRIDHLLSSGKCHVWHVRYSKPEYKFTVACFIAQHFNFYDYRGYHIMSGPYIEILYDYNQYVDDIAPHIVVF